MANLNVSAAHSLKLIPIGRLARFAQISSRVKMILLSDPDDSQAIPGSIKVSMTTDDTKNIKKSLTYKRRAVSAEVADQMEAYRAIRLIAVYVDELGNKRVCGSPDFPLRFSYTSGAGVFTCKLEGESNTIDLFIS